MMGEQTPLSTLENDRKRIEEILGLLDVERELALRADLAVELVRETSIIQDSLERGLYPFLEERGETIVVQQMRLSSEHVREAMRPVYDATRHTVPINVHTNNPAAVSKGRCNASAGKQRSVATTEEIAREDPDDPRAKADGPPPSSQGV